MLKESKRQLVPKT